MRLILLFLLNCPILAFAQLSNGFAPLGATWIECQTNWRLPNTIEITTVVSDSLGTSNTHYKKLYAGIVDTTNHITHYQNFFYMITRNDSVWVDTIFGSYQRLLFNFNAHIGDSMVIEQAGFGIYAYGIVDSIRTINFNGQMRQATYYTKHCSSSPNWLTRITSVVVAGFGLLDEHWNWSPTDCLGSEGPYYIPICYSDSSMFYPQNCLLSTQITLEKQNSIRIFPNPTTDLLHITTNPPFKHLKITDLMGNTLLEKTVNSTETTISIAFLPKGLYFCSIFVENKKMQTLKIVKIE